MAADRSGWKKFVKERMDHLDAYERQLAYGYVWRDGEERLARNETRNQRVTWRVCGGLVIRPHPHTDRVEERGSSEWKTKKSGVKHRERRLEEIQGEDLIKDRRGNITKNMDENLKSLTALMKNVAQEVCPAKVMRKEVVQWMTAEIQKLKKRRNRARRDMNRRRGEWTDICRELKEKTILAKRETWRKQLEKIRNEKNVNRAWSVVKQMNSQGSKTTRAPCFIGANGGQPPNAKANAFIQEYAEINSGKSTKKTRIERVNTVNHLRKIAPGREIEKDLTIVELKLSARALKNGKAPGPDGIRPEFLKHLPDVTLNQVLTLANHSWREYERV